MKQIIILGLLLLSLPSVFAYDISEIMYDPLGSDSNREWVEVYGDPLDDVQFVEDGNLHSLSLVQGSCVADCVSIIADDALLFLEEYNLSSQVLLYDSSWSSLKNSGEVIGLVKNTTVVVEVDYSPLCVAGETLQLIDADYSCAEANPGEIYIHEDIEEVPEFGVVGVLLFCGLSLFFIFRNRQE